MADRLGKAVLELSTESAGFFREIDKAKGGANQLDASFLKVRNSARALGPDLASALAASNKLAGATNTIGAGVGQLGTAVGGTTNKVAAFASSVDQVDRVLASAGIRIGGHVGALKELGAIAGQTAGSLGLMATGALAVAAAMTGWNVGRWIADVGGFDKAISNTVASLLGWANEGAQEAAAKTELLNRASLLAGRRITDFGEALKIVTEEGRRSSNVAIDFSLQLARAEQHVAGLDASMIAQIQTAQKAGATQQQLTDKYGLGALELQLLTERTKAQKDADEEAAEARKKAAAEFTKAQDAMFGRDLIARAKDAVRVLGDVSNITIMAADKKEELRKTILAALDAYQRLGLVAPKVMRDIATATGDLQGVSRVWVMTGLKPAVEASSALLTEVRSLGIDAVPLLSASIHESRVGFVGLKEGLEDTKEGAAIANREVVTLSQTIGQNLKSALAGIPQTLVNAFTGGGGLKGAFKAIGVQLAEAIATPLLASLGAKLAGSVLGSVAAGAIGSSVAGGTAAAVSSGALGAVTGAAAAGTAASIAGTIAIGAATAGIGLAVVGVALLAKKWLGVSKEVKEARARVDEFQKGIHATLTEQQRAAAGGESWKATLIGVRDAYLSIGRTSAEAEDVVGRLLNTDDPRGADAAMREIGIAFEEVERRAKELAKRTEEANSLFDELMAAAQEAGGAIPDAMRPAVEQMIEYGLLTEEQVALLRGLGDSAKVDFKKMEEAAGVFQGRLDALGPAFQQAKIDETAAKYINALDVMIRGGADVGGVLFDAKEELGALVADALRSGSTLAENLRPFVEELHRTGQLLDENGNAITDLSQIKWGEAIKTDAQLMKETFDALLKKFDEFFEKIGDGSLDVKQGINDQAAALDRAKSDWHTWGDEAVSQIGRVEDALRSVWRWTGERPVPIPLAALRSSLSFDIGALRSSFSPALLRPAAAGVSSSSFVAVPIIVSNGNVERAVDETMRQFGPRLAGNNHGVRTQLVALLKESLRG